MSDRPELVPHEEVMAASHSGDVSTVVGMYSDDAILMPPNDTTVYGKEEIQSWWEDYFQFFRITSSVETERDVTLAGNQAFERASFSGTIIPKEGGVRIHDDIRSLIVWKRAADGSWKISHHIWNSTKPVGAGTNRYMTRMMAKKRSRSTS